MEPADRGIERDEIGDGADLDEREAWAMRAAAGMLRCLGQTLPSCSRVGAELTRWATELSLAAEERAPSPVPSGVASLHAP